MLVLREPEKKNNNNKNNNQRKPKQRGLFSNFLFFNLFFCLMLLFFCIVHLFAFHSTFFVPFSVGK